MREGRAGEHGGVGEGACAEEGEEPNLITEAQFRLLPYNHHTPLDRATHPIVAPYSRVLHYMYSCVQHITLNT